MSSVENKYKALCRVISMIWRSKTAWKISMKWREGCNVKRKKKWLKRRKKRKRRPWELQIKINKRRRKTGKRPWRDRTSCLKRWQMLDRRPWWTKGDRTRRPTSANARERRKRRSARRKRRSTSPKAAIHRTKIPGQIELIVKANLSMIPRLTNDLFLRQKTTMGSGLAKLTRSRLSLQGWIEKKDN